MPRITAYLVTSPRTPQERRELLYDSDLTGTRFAETPQFIERLHRFIDGSGDGSFVCIQRDGEAATYLSESATLRPVT
jgi:hypothetical protein